MALSAKQVWFEIHGKTRIFMKWQLKILISESIPEEVGKWRWETGAAVPGKVVCMYDAVVKGVHLKQMRHGHHGQRILRKMRRCKISDERCLEFSEGWGKINKDLLGILCSVATECAKSFR
jgi:hypothetical protein